MKTTYIILAVILILAAIGIIYFMNSKKTTNVVTANNPRGFINTTTATPTATTIPTNSMQRFYSYNPSLNQSSVQNSTTSQKGVPKCGSPRVPPCWYIGKDGTKAIQL